jgi:peptide/nickel transport system permease protein
MRYLLVRIGQSVFVLAGVSLLSFVFLQLAPGNFFSEMRLNPQVSDETVQNLRREFALDKPLLTRYWRWLQSVFRGELGFSLAYNSPVAPLLMARTFNTLLLATTSMVLAWCIAVPLGVVAAATQNGWVARVSTFGNSLILATPELLLALLALMLAAKHGWLRSAPTPLSSSDHVWEGLRNALTRMVLPLAVLVLTSIPVLLRHTAAAVRDTLSSPFVAAARAHGIRPSRIWFYHALKPALNPLVSLFGTSLASLLSASLLVEVVMGWPGIGPLLVEAILNRDIYVVIAGIMLSAVFLVMGTLVADVLLFAVDPRIRAERLA